jgi:hypothetical protein
VWERLLAQLQSVLEQGSNVDWESHYIDSTTMRAHQHAAGVKKSSAEAEALGRSRGGLSTKIHLRCENQGKLITFLLSPGQESDIGLAEPLLERSTIRRSTGRPRLRPKRLVADKVYTSARFRRHDHARYHFPVFSVCKHTLGFFTIRCLPSIA